MNRVVVVVSGSIGCGDVSSGGAVGIIGDVGGSTGGGVSGGVVGGAVGAWERQKLILWNQNIIFQ